MEQDKPDPEFDRATNRMLRREALRRAAEELNTTSPAGLESVLGRIAAEVTAEAAEKHASQGNDPKPAANQPPSSKH